MAQTMPRPARRATPDRWQKALARAIAAGVQVWQLAGSGQWIATSASDAGRAYEVAVVNGVARSCTCQAGEFGDLVCCHRAAYYHATGALAVVPERPAVVVCDGCGRKGYPLQDKPVPVPFFCPRCRPPAAPAAARRVDPGLAAMLAA